MSFIRTTYKSDIDAFDALVRSLAAFEQKYNIPSDEFYAQYLTGQMKDSKDYVEWAGDYQHYISLKRELEHNLKVVA